MGTNSRDLQAFRQTVTATAGSLISPFADGNLPSSYHNAMTDITRELRKPTLQQKLFTFNSKTPSELVRSKLSTQEIRYRAVTFLPDEVLHDIPDAENTYSLFQGFQASLPEPETKKKGKKGPKAITDSNGSSSEVDEPETMTGLESDRAKLTHRLEMLGIRKNMASSEIRDIDMKIANLNAMRNIVLNRLASLEEEESQTEHEIVEVDNKIEDLRYDMAEGLVPGNMTDTGSDGSTPSGDNTFMSDSIYKKLPSPKSRKHRPYKRISMPILHEHFEPGTNIKELQTHNDSITALDFDVPFGTLVTAAFDDTVRVWDLNNGRCLGLLEGHNASVRCLQVEDNFVATGSMDATVRIWDLSRAEHYRAGESEENANDHVNLSDCGVHTLEAHVAEITALHFQGDTLISGSADKTLRQWDLQAGRCVQTLDVLWAAAQNSMVPSSDTSRWGASTGRGGDSKADFIGAVQCFDAALACGTADGMVRLWDLRSGQVHRSLVGHTGPVTCLQFDDVHLVTGSLDRSIRIWDLRTGSIFDVYGYENPVTAMQFDARRIVSAAGQNVVKIYDKTDGRHWDCGAGVNEGKGAVVEKVRIQDGYLVEGRKDGVVGVWAC
ncbi:WD40 repeat-like protein [Ascobolus immersus RN42]|uniref:Mitochondrial division protein 1 n=1 Tax=Ascobolus immersus RN42 TaxID=1160509 RepID=A0A3N4IG07_ASCIM|nr:WD40 repeat-like protein [Ascobolus immersus RN42]